MRRAILGAAAGALLLAVVGYLQEVDIVEHGAYFTNDVARFPGAATAVMVANLVLYLDVALILGSVVLTLILAIQSRQWLGLLAILLLPLGLVGWLGLSFGDLAVGLLIFLPALVALGYALSQRPHTSTQNVAPQA